MDCCQIWECDNHNYKSEGNCVKYTSIDLCMLLKRLKSKTEPVAEVPCSAGLDAHAIKAQLDKLLNKVNAVTCPYRHGQKVTDRVLTELSNRQLDVEEALREMGI